MSDYKYSFCRVAQARSVGSNAVAVAVGDSQDEADANAARIVECVNAHDALTARVAELEGALRAFIAGADAGRVTVETDRAARAALAKAR